MIRKIFFGVLVLISISSLYAQDGLIKTYYPNGALKSEINYSDAKRNGTAKFYYENGNIQEERTYIYGKVEGVVKLYNENGKLKELINIENGKREGPTSYYNDNGDYSNDLMFEGGKLEAAKLEEPEPASKQLAENDQKKVEIGKLEKNSRQKAKQEIVPVPPLAQNKNFDSDPAIYLTAEIMPVPVGGMSALQKKVVYPEGAREKKIEGTVKILAVIDEFGEVQSAEVKSGIGYGCDEAARIAVYYTKFKPALQRGKPVKVQFIIPIEFKLDKK